MGRPKLEAVEERCVEGGGARWNTKTAHGLLGGGWYTKKTETHKQKNNRG